MKLGLGLSIANQIRISGSGYGSGYGSDSGGGIGISLVDQFLRYLSGPLFGPRSFTISDWNMGYSNEEETFRNWTETNNGANPPASNNYSSFQLYRAIKNDNSPLGTLIVGIQGIKIELAHPARLNNPFGPDPYVSFFSNTRINFTEYNIPITGFTAQGFQVTIVPSTTNVQEWIPILGTANGFYNNSYWINNVKTTLNSAGNGNWNNQTYQNGSVVT